MWVVNFYDGKKTHEDGSPFYDMKILKSKKEAEEFMAELDKKGYKAVRTHPMYRND